MDTLILKMTMLNGLILYATFLFVLFRVLSLLSSQFLFFYLCTRFFSFSAPYFLTPLHNRKLLICLSIIFSIEYLSVYLHYSFSLFSFFPPIFVSATRSSVSHSLCLSHWISKCQLVQILRAVASTSAAELGVPNDFADTWSQLLPDFSAASCSSLCQTFDGTQSSKQSDRNRGEYMCTKKKEKTPIESVIKKKNPFLFLFSPLLLLFLSFLFPPSFLFSTTISIASSSGGVLSMGSMFRKRSSSRSSGNSNFPAILILH